MVSWHDKSNILVWDFILLNSLTFQTIIIEIEITRVCYLGLKFDTFIGMGLDFLNSTVEEHFFIFWLRPKRTVIIGFFRTIIYLFCYASCTYGWICSKARCTSIIFIVIPSSLGSNVAHISWHGHSICFGACIQPSHNKPE